MAPPFTDERALPDSLQVCQPARARRSILCADSGDNALAGLANVHYAARCAFATMRRELQYSNRGFLCGQTPPHSSTAPLSLNRTFDSGASIAMIARVVVVVVFDVVPPVVSA